jgi:hypothetical protein
MGVKRQSKGLDRAGLRLEERLRATLTAARTAVPASSSRTFWSRAPDRQAFRRHDAHAPLGERPAVAVGIADSPCVVAGEAGDGGERSVDPESFVAASGLAGVPPAD